MRFSILVLGCAVLVGCAPDQERVPPPLPLTLEELAVDVGSTERGFFLSDKTGGILTGSISTGSLAVELSWELAGGEILRSVALGAASSGTPRSVTGGRILPSHAWCGFEGGEELEIEPLETGIEGVHALLLVVKTGPEAIVPLVSSATALGRPTTLGSGEGLIWRGKPGTLVLYGGEGLKEGDRGLVLAPGGVHRILLCYSSGDPSAESSAKTLDGRIDALREARRERLEALLGRSMLRVSDSLLTRAANWFMLSLDALVFEGRDTMFIAGAPWDGSYDLRAAAQSVTGLEIATAGRLIAPSILRSAARWQDTVSSSPTYGRLPVRLSKSGPQYGAADVTAWFIREQYEHIARSADTALVHEALPRGAPEH